MPEMNGFEATEYIRKKLELTLPIIALTADVTTVDVAKFQKQLRIVSIYPTVYSIQVYMIVLI